MEVIDPIRARTGRVNAFRVLAPCALAFALYAPPLASAADPATSPPLGIPCQAQNGVRFCSGYSPAVIDTTTPANSHAAGPDKRVAVDNGLLDVDVTLPASGSGPFPTIVMLHGWGNSKTSFESSTPAGDGNVTYHYNNVYFAQRGYMVVNYTARGFGDSCGSSSSRTPACAMGWLHLKDRAVEARDTQLLLGTLVDQGYAKADALGATGISYGGGESIELALLHDRTATRDSSTHVETLGPWKSPAGTPLSLAAAWPRWPWSDLVSSLTPNGHFLDFNPASAGTSLSPIGIPIESYIAGLYATGQASGFYSPPGVDPTADLTPWNTRINGGDPYSDPYAQSIVAEIYGHHQGYGLLDVPGASQTPAPLLIENGWTDDLFPPAEALRIYNDLRRRNPAADVALQFGDLGHSRGQNKLNTNMVFNAEGSNFFDTHLMGAISAPPKGSVTTFTQTCPKDVPAGGPFAATSWAGIHPGALLFGDLSPTAPSQTVTSAGGDPQTAKTIDPIAGGGACATVPAALASGTANYTVKSKGFTLMGLPTVAARIAVTGLAPQLNSRLWDVDPGGQQTLISRGALRISDQDIANGFVVFQLHGNGWRFDAGHTVKLELVGNDSPYLQANKEPFQVTVSNLVIELPTLEGAGVTSQIVTPVLGRGGKLVTGAKLRLKLTARPSRIHRNRRTRVRFTVTTFYRKRNLPVRGVTVRIANRRLKTDRSGHAYAWLRYRKRGRKIARVSLPGFIGGQATITVLRR